MSLTSLGESKVKEVKLILEADDTEYELTKSLKAGTEKTKTIVIGLDQNEPEVMEGCQDNSK